MPIRQEDDAFSELEFRVGKSCDVPEEPVPISDPTSSILSKEVYEREED